MTEQGLAAILAAGAALPHGMALAWLRGSELGPFDCSFAAETLRLGLEDEVSRCWRALPKKELAPVRG